VVSEDLERTSSRARLREGRVGLVEDLNWRSVGILVEFHHDRRNCVVAWFEPTGEIVDAGGSVFNGAIDEPRCEAACNLFGADRGTIAPAI
jgi:hypothetical protein